MRTTYLQQSTSGIFYLRIPVPKRLQTALGHREIKRSLRTRDRIKAQRDSGRYVCDILDIFTQLETGMDVDDLKKAAARSAFKLKETRHRDGTEVTELEVNPNIPGDVEQGMEAWRQHKAQQSQSNAVAISTHTQATHPVHVPLTDHGAQPVPPAHASEKPPKPSRPHQSILDVVDAYIEFKLDENEWQPQTADEHRPKFRLFHDIIGDCDLRDVTEDHCRLFINTLTKLPTNMSKHYPGMSHHQVLKTLAGAPGKAVERLSLSTRKKIRETVTALFEWLVETKQLPTNPFSGIKRQRRSSSSNRNKTDKYRVAYSTEDLQKLILAAGYLTRHFKYRYQYWVMLIGLFSGGRENEIAQLHVNDIQKLNGIWVFSFNPEDSDETGKRVKSADSKRWIPIHPKLIALGFLDYVKEMDHGNPLDRLFPELTWTQKAGYGKRVCEWFNGKNTGNGKRYLGVRDKAGFRAKKGKDFHTFRATIASYMRNKCKLVDEQFGAVLGHANKTVSGTVYADPYAMEVLKSYIDQVNFDGALVDVSPYKDVTFGSRSKKKTASNTQKI